MVVLESKYMLKCYDYPTIMVVFFFLIFLLAKDICFICVIFIVLYFVEGVGIKGLGEVGEGERGMLSQKFGHASYFPIISLLFFIFQS